MCEVFFGHLVRGTAPNATMEHYNDKLSLHNSTLVELNLARFEDWTNLLIKFRATQMQSCRYRL